MQRGFPLALTLLLLSSSLAALAVPASAASVEVENDLLPAALVGSAAATVNGETFVFGGRFPDGSYSPEIMGIAGKVDAIVRNVEQFTAGGNVEAKPGRYSGAAAALGTKIYYFGGAQLVEMDVNGDGAKESVPKASRDIFEFDPAQRRLALLPDKLPYPLFGMTAVAAEGKVWLFGGFEFDITDAASIQRHKEILAFEPAKAAGSRVRTVSDALPYAVQDAAGAYIGNRIVVMGGLSDHDNDTNPCPTYVASDGSTRQPKFCLTRRIVSFDPASELVRGVAGELPYRVQFARAAVVDGKAYVPGGLLSDGSASSSIVEVAMASGTATVRTLTPTLPVAAFGQGVTADGDTMLVFGGRTGGEAQLQDAILRIRPGVTAPWSPRSATTTEIAGGVRLSWEPPAYNGDAPVTGYRIYRAGPEGNESRLAETASLSYEDKTTRPGVEYVWRITAVNSAGESDQSARLTRTASVSAPGAVTGFQAFPGNNEVTMRWQPPTETGGANITGYRIYRASGAEVAKVLASLGPENTTFEDRGVTNGVAYVYHVRAVNAARGEGAASELVRVTPAAVPAPPTGIFAEVREVSGGSSVQLTWVPPNEPVQRYVVYRTTSLGQAPTRLPGDVATTSFVDAAVERGRTYYYTIVSVNEVGESPPSPATVVSLVRKPGAPTDVVALGLDGEIRVQWQAPADTGDAPPSALRYYVTRVGGGSSRAIIVKTDIEGTTFLDRAVTPGQSYTYSVTTLNPMQSDPSDAASAIAKAAQNKPPTALLAILPSVTSAGDPVELDASQSSDPDGAIKSWIFDFGDGTEPVRASQPSVTHAYANNGSFTATVIAIDERNAESAIASAVVIVGELESEGDIDDGLPDAGQPTTPTSERPGAQTPKVPGPGVLLAAIAVAGAALLARRRRG